MRVALRPQAPLDGAFDAHRRMVLAAAVLLCVAAVRPAPRTAATSETATAAWCVTIRGGVPVAHGCDGAVERGWYASHRERAAVGMPLCWWTATEGAFDEVGGVGAGVASALARYRDDGGLPTAEGLRGVRGVGGAAAARIEAAVTPRCAMAPGADSGLASRSGR